MGQHDEIDEMAAENEAITETKHAVQRSANVAKQWWKDELKFWKTKPMPKSEWKKSLINLPWMPEKKAVSKNGSKKR